MLSKSPKIFGQPAGTPGAPDLVDGSPLTQQPSEEVREALAAALLSGKGVVHGPLDRDVL